MERDEFLRVPGKGGWHDPDMLLAGETPCSAEATRAGMKCNVLPIEEQKTQLAIWAMASAPLLLSADLTNIPNASMAILTNREILSINQDALGRMPFRFIADATLGVDGTHLPPHCTVRLCQDPLLKIRTRCCAQSGGRISPAVTSRLPS